MKTFLALLNRKHPLLVKVSFFIILLISFQQEGIQAQCVNADFENGDFTGWTGTWGKATFFDTATPAEWSRINTGINEGAVNAAPDDATGNHFLMTAGGFDAAIAGSLLPTVFPGKGTTSVRMGSSVAQGRGETLTYSYTVTEQSTNFTYHYAAVIADIDHSEAEQPYFKIRMVDQAGNEISCASYDVNGLSAPTIGGFTSTGTLQWKNWSSVSIPLLNYIGQRVSITFETRVCAAGGSVGSHPAWAYIDAECDSLAIIPSSPAVCAGETVTLTAPAAQGYVWEGPGIVSGGSSQAAVVDAPGTYTVTVTTLGNTPCTYSLTAVMPGSLPGGSAVSSDSAITCIGGSATLTASTAASYLWEPGGETTQSITVSPAATTSYTVTGFSADCGSGQGIGLVTVNPIPTSPFTVSTVCVDEESLITYTGNAPPEAVYNWDFGTGTVVSGTGQGPYLVSWSTSGSKNVSLSVTVGDCQSPPTTEAVTVNPIYDPTFSYSPTTICKTGGTDPSPNVTDAGGTFTATAGLVIDANTGLVDLTASPLGSYTITYSHSGPCPTSSTFNIDIVDVPVADFTLGDYCQNVANPTPTYINSGTAGTFTSTAGLVFVSPIVIPGEINLAASTPGTYTVTNTVGGGGGCPQVTADVNITINAIPVLTVNDMTICEGETAVLNAIGADAFLWNDGSATSSITVMPTTTTTYTLTGTTAGCSSDTISTVSVIPLPLVTVTDATACDGDTTVISASGASAYLWSNGSTAAAIQITPTAPTSYTVTGTTQGCSVDAVSNVSVNAKPTVTASDDVFICEGNDAILSATGATTYLWADTAFTDLSFDNPATISPTATTQYNVYGSTADCNSLPNVTDAERNAYFACFTSGCIGGDSLVVTITLKPIVKVNSETICIGETAILTASGGNVYEWETTETGPSINVTPTTAGSITYTVGDNTPGCSGAATSTVTVNPLPTILADPAVICEGGTAILTASGAQTYTWTPGGTGASITVSPTQNTSYSVTGASLAGCISNTVTAVSINPLPEVQVSNDIICNGETATLTASGTASNYAWSDGGTGAIRLVSPASDKTYTVTGSDNVGCSQTASGTVTVFEKPNAAFYYSPDPAGVLDPTITFTDISTGNVSTWNWTFDDGDSIPENSQNPVHLYPPIEQRYTVELAVSNPGNCKDTVRRTIIIGPEFTFFIPNAFSPNDDGINDDFGVSGGGIMDFKLFIFDRWGAQLFYTTDVNGRWNGEYLGNPAQQDTYIWKVELFDVFKKEHNYVGTVNLIK